MAGEKSLPRGEICVGIVASASQSQRGERLRRPRRPMEHAADRTLGSSVSTAQKLVRPDLERWQNRHSDIADKEKYAEKIARIKR
jgi:hypothetical protein